MLDPLGSSMRSAGCLQRVPARSSNTRREKGRRFDQCRPCIAGLTSQIFSALSDRLALNGLSPVRGLSWKRAGKHFFLPGGCKKEWSPQKQGHRDQVAPTGPSAKPGRTRLYDGRRMPSKGRPSSQSICAMIRIQQSQVGAVQRKAKVAGGSKCP